MRPNLYNIIFSNDRSYRWKRHLIFWSVVFLYHTVRIGLMFPPDRVLKDIVAVFNLVAFMGILVNVITCYTVAYFLVPRFYMKRKYIQFAAGLVLLTLIILALLILHVMSHITQTAHSYIGITTKLSFSMFRPGIIRIFGNPPLICCLFLSLKTLKNWHLEQLKTESLQKENTNAEVQLLKAQVHPHFLFNTLNNIYSYSLNKSSMAGALVQKLRNILNYMINECKDAAVPLEKEIKLIRDYMGLEKVRYGDRLNMQIEINGNTENKFIAPLLMIPFVENCFKHGASMMRGQQWIRLQLNITGDQLELNLSNSRPPKTDPLDNKKGIGLANVQKRLQLLYPDKHFLKMESIGDTYTVQLQLNLQRAVESGGEIRLVPKLQPS